MDSPNHGGACSGARDAADEWEEATSVDGKFDLRKRGACQRAMAIGLPCGRLGLALREVFVDERERVMFCGLAQRGEGVKARAAQAARREQRVKRALGPRGGRAESLLVCECSVRQEARDFVLPRNEV